MTSSGEKKTTAKNLNIFVMPQEFRAQKTVAKKKIPLIFFIGGGFLLLMLGIGIFFIFSIPKKQVSTPISKEPQENAPPVEETTPAKEPNVGLFAEKATSTEEILPPPAEEAPASLLVQGTDEDADGLTDKEEAIFQTDSKRPDTDADGFLDGNEVFHLYNPSAIAPVDLLESGIARLYRNAGEGYEIFYPSSWSASSTTDGSIIDFLSTDSESFSVVVKEASESISLRSWYITEYPEGDFNSLQSLTTKKGYQGLQDKDRFNTYIKRDGKIFIISYKLGGVTTIWYRRLYDMMLNSFIAE